MYDPVEVLGERFRDAIRAAYPEVTDPDPLIAPARNRQFGDYQSNAAMKLGKEVGAKSRDVAVKIVEQLELDDLAEGFGAESIAGPGFINVRLRADVLAGLLESMGDGLGIEAPATPETVVVDLVGVNLAKQMHVGHLRSMIIGDALARTFARLGEKVVRQNHVGDWGLPIAMVTERVRREAAAGRVDLDNLTLDELNRLYRDAQSSCAPDRRGLEAARKWWAHPKAMAELEAQVEGADEELAQAKATLLKLQSHEPDTVAIWERIADATMDACLATCKRLNVDVDPDDSAGESSYAEELAGLVEDLESRRVATIDDGALVVDLTNQGVREPCIIRKSDGGFLYATTDIAGVRRRVRTLEADRVVYAVDARQGLHFKQVFLAATKAGYATKDGADAPSSLEHAAFGTILGEDGKPFKTRSGENVKLTDLIDDAVARAMRKVEELNPELGPDERAKVAEAVAVAAIKYADLSSDRIRDYVFSLDRMVAFEGATGPYLLYAVVRIRSIFRKARERFGDQAVGGHVVLGATEEKDLALALVRYPGVVRDVARTLEPHRLCQYLYELAGLFNGFFQSCPVIKADDEATRASRLRLCELTERVLVDGLGVLGIETLERM